VSLLSEVPARTSRLAQVCQKSRRSDQKAGGISRKPVSS
jgi:hypothetical protein